MQRTDVIEFAIMLGLGPPARTSTANWLHYRCPLAPWKHQNKRDRIPSFGIAVTEDKDSHYNCFACHSHGLFHQLAYELGHLRGTAKDLIPVGDQIKKHEFNKTTIVRKWIEDVGELHEAAKNKFEWPAPEREYDFNSAVGHPYLRERGISWATAIALGLRYDPFQRRILFPVKDRAGRFAGFTGRRVDAAYMDGEDGPLERDGTQYIKVRDYFGLRKREFLLGEHRIRLERLHKKVVILVEGLFDYAGLTEMGARNVIALLGSALTPEKADKLTRYDGVILFLDNDAAGTAAIDNIKVQLFKKVPLIEVKYPEGYEGADPASLPPSVVKDMLSNRRQILRLTA